MNGLMTAHTAQKPLNYFRVAWQSALAAALCLGLPAGLSLWLILLQQVYKSNVVEAMIGIFQAHGLYRIYLVALSSVLWSYLLGRISGYRQWWWIAVASATAIMVVWFSALVHVYGILFDYF